MEDREAEFASFSRTLLSHFGIEAQDVSRDDKLDELGFDSLELFEIYLALAHVAGRETPPELVTADRTLLDLFEWFKNAGAEQG